MRKKHVFLSYCHENKAEISQLRRELIGQGEVVFWDEDILPGQSIPHTLREAIRQSYAFVFCLSKETGARSKSGILPEARDAFNALRQYSPASVFIIVVRLSECPIPSIPIDATNTLADLLYIDLFPPSGRNAGLSRLLQAIRATPEHP
jgi:hypothetical protein